MSDDVARYYDRNTRRFLLMGGARGVHSIHRELWGAEVRSAHEAADHINRLLADEIAGLDIGPEPSIVDFGCGVGGTLFHLAQRMPKARLLGITISRRQVEIAERFVEKLGHADACSFSLGDFHTADTGVRADVVLAVESFAHSHSAEAFLANAVRNLGPEGRLIVVDDFLASEKESLATRQRRRVEQFQAGWRVPAICTEEHLVHSAAQHGLRTEKTVDLTSLTRPGSRVRDRLTAIVSPLLARLGLSRIPFCGNLIGGNALQIGLRDGFLRYRFLVFRKQA
jgi:cyclopropane fatty-acyl-phospholipid synthase-like methyltransferase